MKIVFIFPFKNKKLGSPIKWLPAGSAVLIGNIKRDFPQIIFHQIDLEEEIKKAFKENKFDKNYLKVINCLSSIKRDIPTNKDLTRFNNFFSDLVDYLKLGSYDHYFFSVYERYKIGIKANILLARYLKNKYKKKKIVFGGIFGVGDEYGEKMRKRIFFSDFVDACVVGPGEISTKEIIINLLDNKELKRVYQKFTPPNLCFIGPPDYKKFKSIKYFQHSCDDLETLYNIDLPKNKTSKKILFIPYMFSLGCFWSKCSYCRQSRRSQRPNFFLKNDISQIINDLFELKENYNTNFFIFYNNNFNSNLEFSKKLLRAIIKSKLNILWTDSFNLRVMDNELLDLLVQSGCFRMDIGCAILNPKLQKLYHNILQNRHLRQLKRISERGIWTQINVIVNMPYQYTVKKDKAILNRYMPYIDSVSLYNYIRKIGSDLGENYEKYDLKIINEKIHTRGFQDSILYYIENDFKGTIEKRKKLFVENNLELRNFFTKHKKPVNSVHLYLLGYLYNNFGFGNKDKIRKIVNKAESQNI